MARNRKRATACETRRQELMDAALALLLEQGLANTGIEQITARAGVAKGTFYIYFPSKQALFEQLQIAYLGRLLDRIELNMETSGEDSWQGIMTVWASTLIDFYLENHEEQALLFEQTIYHSSADFARHYIVGSLADLLEKKERPRNEPGRV